MCRRKQTQICLMVLFIMGLFLATAVQAAPYNFQLDRFELVGNPPFNAVDEFDDGNLDLLFWEIYDDTVIESGSTVSFRNPGTVNQGEFGTLSIKSEMSYIHGNYPITDQAGDYAVTSTWVPAIPGVNQLYWMKLITDENLVERERIQIGVGNFDADISGYLGLPSGPLVFFGRSADIPGGDFAFQGFTFTPADLAGDILLRLAFDADQELFAGSFSLDGGAGFLNPFTDVAANDARILDHAELVIGVESWEVVEAVPAPSVLLLMLSGLACLVGMKSFRRGRIG